MKNAERTAVKNFYSIMKQNPDPISGTDLLNTMVGTTFNFERETIPAQMWDSLPQELPHLLK